MAAKNCKEVKYGAWRIIAVGGHLSDIAIVAAVLGLGGIAGLSLEIVWIIVIVFVILFVISLVASLFRR